MPTPGGERARILVICTGNICRSPYMQFALSSALDSAGVGDVVVTSAGTQAVPDSGVAPDMARLLAEAGIDTREFVTRRLTRQMLAEADLVLGAARLHRREAVLLEPRALPRAFTLRQFGRLLPVSAALPPGRHRLPESSRERLRRLIQQCSAARAGTRSGGEADDVSDPWGLPLSAYRRAVDEMAPAIATIAGAMAPPDRTT